MTTTNYMWSNNTISRTVLQAATSLDIGNWTLQADQTIPALAWREPCRELTKRPVLSSMTTMLDFTRRGDGFYSFTWGWKWLTPQQFGFIINTYFSAASVWSHVATVQTWYENDTYYAVGGSWYTFNCTAWRPVFGEDYDIQDGMFTNVVVKFVGGVINVA